MSRRFEELDWQQTPMGEISLRRRLEPHAAGRRLRGQARRGVPHVEPVHRRRDRAGPPRAGRRRRATASTSSSAAWASATPRSPRSRTPRVRSLAVVEALAEVIAWHERRLLPDVDGLTADPRTRLVAGRLLRARGGRGRLRRRRRPDRAPRRPPRHRPHPAARAAPQPRGLLHRRRAARGCAATCTPGGVFALWSDDPPDEDFLTCCAPGSPRRQGTSCRSPTRSPAGPRPTPSTSPSPDTHLSGRDRRDGDAAPPREDDGAMAENEVSGSTAADATDRASTPRRRRGRGPRRPRPTRPSSTGRRRGDPARRAAAPGVRRRPRPPAHPLRGARHRRRPGSPASSRRARTPFSTAPPRRARERHPGLDVASPCRGSPSAAVLDSSDGAGASSSAPPHRAGSSDALWVRWRSPSWPTRTARCSSCPRTPRSGRCAGSSSGSTAARASAGPVDARARHGRGRRRHVIASSPGTSRCRTASSSPSAAASRWARRRGPPRGPRARGRRPARRRVTPMSRSRSSSGTARRRGPCSRWRRAGRRRASSSRAGASADSGGCCSARWLTARHEHAGRVVAIVTR